jgi:CBS domain-containing protein
MRARDLMSDAVLTVGEDDTVEDLVKMLVDEHINGAPVVNRDGALVGIVTQQDIFFGSMTRGADALENTENGVRNRLRVRDFMTAPAVTVTEDTDVDAICRLMVKLRIHRLPVIHEGRITGIISSLDVCGAVAHGRDLA